MLVTLATNKQMIQNQLNSLKTNVEGNFLFWWWREKNRKREGIAGRLSITSGSSEGSKVIWKVLFLKTGWTFRSSKGSSKESLWPLLPELTEVQSLPMNAREVTAPQGFVSAALTHPWRPGRPCPLTSIHVVQTEQNHLLSNKKNPNFLMDNQRVAKFQTAPRACVF